ncbi:MAG: 23S rRNA (guanosine(2251)-2'-O)-methyltransferase RlmB [Firmicutes bacterium]|nr:23S rRNA (guanosine(2251)-2'-O)-methyltransferase RlmB [Bacillota bacterium]
MAEEKGQIEGLHPVLEALRAGRPIHKIFLARENTARLGTALAAARAAKVPVVKVARATLDRMATTRNHQGIIALAAPKAYTPLLAILAAASAGPTPPFLLALDGVEDPQNLGALIRTAEAMGVNGVILPERRAAGLTAAVDRASAGALAHMPVARVTNLARTLRELKEYDYLIVGADPAAEAWEIPPIHRAMVLVLGGEGTGLRRLVKEACDVLVAIPMYGQINSLNVSAAGAILLYALAKGRKAPTTPSVTGELPATRKPAWLDDGRIPSV